MVFRRSLVPPLAAAGLAASGLAAAAAVLARVRRWAAAPDPADGLALADLEGVPRTVATSDGASISLTDGGPPDGPVVVMAHGYTEDRRVWTPVARRLAGAGSRVIVYDQRGHGQSDVGRSGYTIDALADDLRDVLEELDLRDVTLAGHSMGGMAAQALIIRHPDLVGTRLRSLVLVATACADVGVTGRRGELAVRLFGHPGFAWAAGNPVIGPLLVRGTVGRHPVLSHLKAMAAMLASTPAATRTGFLTAMGTMDLTEDIGAIDLPVTVVVGSRDQLTPADGARRMAELIPGARLQVVPDAGHMLTYEVPDLLAELIVDSASASAPAVPASEAEAARVRGRAPISSGK